MKDTWKILFGLILFLSAWLIMREPLARVLSKALNISPQEVANSLNVLLNTLMLVMMFVTILVSNQSSLDQIATIKASTVEQIKTIQSTTQRHLDSVDRINKESKKALLSALILELKNNLRSMEEMIAKESVYTDSSGKGMVALNIFSFEAYQANLDNATIDDPILIDKMVQTYGGLKLIQRFIDAADKPMVPRQYQADTLGRAIKQMKDNFETLKTFIGEVVEYNKTHYE